MIDTERIKELRDFLVSIAFNYRGEAGFTDLLAVLDDYEGLRLEQKYPDPEDMPGELAAKYCPFNDHLHFHHDGCPSEWAIEKEIERLRAENERLEKLTGDLAYALGKIQVTMKADQARAEKAEAENERWGEVCARRLDERDALKAELERARAALQEAAPFLDAGGEVAKVVRAEICHLNEKAKKGDASMNDQEQAERIARDAYSGERPEDEHEDR